MEARGAFAQSGEVAGVPDQRLRVLPRYALERSPGYGGKRAAAVLAGCLERVSILQRSGACGPGVGRGRDACTRVSETHVPDEVYEEAKKHFNEKELADLTLAVVAINGWNRLAIAARTTPGTYQPARRELKKAA